MSKYGQVRVIQTVRDSRDRLTEKEPIAFAADEEERENELLNLYPDVEYQEIEGFGGAFTEAAAVTLAIAPHAIQTLLVGSE